MTMTFYIFNLSITCYVIPDVIHYCTVCKHGFQQRKQDSI